MSGRITDYEVIELLSHLLQVKVSREQLAKPTKHFVLDIYCRFLNEFGVENLNQPNLMACTGIDNIEIMEGAILIMNTFRALRHYLAKVGINDLTVADIVAPKRNRTIQLIAALSSFLNHVIRLKTMWLEHCEKIKHIPQKRFEMKLKIMKMKHEIEEKTMLLSSLKDKTVGMDKQAAELEEKLIRKKSEAEKEAEKSKNIKSSILELRERLGELDLKTSTVKEETQKKLQEIVRSPQKKINETKQQHEQLEKAKQEVPKLKCEMNTLTARSNLYNTCKQTLQKSTDGFQDLLQLTANLMEKAEELKNAQVEIEEIKNEIASLDIQLKGIESSEKTLQAQLNKENKNYQRQKAIVVELKTGLQKKLHGMESTSSNFQQEVMQLERRLLELDRDIASVEKTREETVNELREMEMEMVSENTKDLEELAKQLEITSDCNI